MPEILRATVNGFDFLSDMLRRTSYKQAFLLNFESVEKLDPNLCAVLASIIVTNRKRHGASFECSPIKNEFVKRTLTNNGFFEKVLDGAKRTASINSGIPLMIFDMKNVTEVEEYIYRYLLSSSNIPKMSDGAKRKIFRSIFEIYQNSVMHSGADKIFVCGQYYKFRGIIALTMVEVGRTFKDNLMNFNSKYSNYSGSKSIEWAVKPGNTTKLASETGGLGLDLIREFLRLNHGKLQIKSAEGYWEEKKGATFAQDSKYHFNGSIVNIEFNIRDPKTYFIAEDIDIKDIL